MAWIAPIPPFPRPLYERYQVRYQDGKGQRSAGIFPTKRRALAAEGAPSAIPSPASGGRPGRISRLGPGRRPKLSGAAATTILAPAPGPALRCACPTPACGTDP
jgi:hypothetical protein